CRRLARRLPPAAFAMANASSKISRRKGGTNGQTTPSRLADRRIVARRTRGRGARQGEGQGRIHRPAHRGVSANGLGGRNSADLAVRLRNADAKAKYEYELVVLDDECKPNVAVQQATKLAAEKDIVSAATHYCSAAAIAAVDTYHKF